MITSATDLLSKVLPTDLAAAAVGPSRSFLATVGEAPLLCVELGETPGNELQVGLSASVDPQTAPANRALGFHTEMAPMPVKVSRATSHGFSASALAARLATTPHFALSLVKRAEATMSQDRISVGRARNTDVVLRDGSVSKFHAWFEIDAAGAVRVADAGSKNGTRLGDQPLPPRELVPIAFGQAVVFGNVRAFLCEPSAFWEAFHLA